VSTLGEDCLREDCHCWDVS